MAMRRKREKMSELSFLKELIKAINFQAEDLKEENNRDRLELEKLHLEIESLKAKMEGESNEP